MRREHTSVSQEDYLKALWELLEENQVPISARLAEELNVTPPAVTAALKRMTRDGHVKIERGGRIHLTEKGRKNAQHLMLRHQLAEMLLTEVIGLSWSDRCGTGGPALRRRRPFSTGIHGKTYLNRLPRLRTGRSS